MRHTVSDWRVSELAERYLLKLMKRILGAELKIQGVPTCLFILGYRDLGDDVRRLGHVAVCGCRSSFDATRNRTACFL